MGKTKPMASIQIGKNGLTDGVLSVLKSAFSDRENVKISVLKSGGHEREEVRKMADKIIESLGNKFTYRVVGFTIFVKKWRKAILRGK